MRRYSARLVRIRAARKAAWLLKQWAASHNADTAATGPPA